MRLVIVAISLFFIKGEIECLVFLQVDDIHLKGIQGDAEISLVTLDRIEKGYDCRLSTKRKILEALGLDFDDKNDVFPENN